MEVFGRPGVVPCLLRFIFAAQPQRAKKSSSRSSFEVSDSVRGRSMLVAEIMDVVTSNTEISQNASFRSLLSARAEMRDIAAAIQVIEGGMNVDDQHSGEDDDGGTGLKEPVSRESAALAAEWLENLGTYAESAKRQTVIRVL